ncbi:MAG: DUF1365 domain-containing protein [Burkholderiaceae bacterium]
MDSAIYIGSLEHRRRAPREHAFRYRLFMVYLDLAELDAVFAGRWLWSTSRRALARFVRADHLGDPAVPLDEAVRSLVAEQTGWRPRGPIRLLTHLRYFGYVFNPVSFYYCFAPDGQALEAVVAEVNNTPWGERHCYVLRPPGAPSAGLRASSIKAMHVSPFNPMALGYDWRFSAPGTRLAVHMALRPLARAPGAEAPEGPGRRDDAPAARKAPVFSATLALRRVPIRTTTLATTLARFPWMTAKVIAAIHWEALRLWLRKVPGHDHPRKRPAPADQTRAALASPHPKDPQ